MTSLFRRIYSLSEEGAKNVCVGILANAAYNVATLAPTVLLFLVASGLLSHYWGISPTMPSLFFWWGAAILLAAIMFFAYRLSYRKTYRSAYDESANVRISLAEKLRQLPLSYFGKKDLSDLTSTLMSDTAVVEHTLAGALPEFFGGFLSSLVAVLLLFFFDWRLALALFACLPVAVAVVVLCRRASTSTGWKNRAAHLAVSEGLQEWLDAMRLMHASPKSEAYRKGLEARIRAVVRTSLLYEVVMGVFISFAYNVLRVGIALVVIVGAALMARGELSIFTFLLFLFVSAQIYDPLTNIIFHAGELFSSLVGAQRVREIEEYPPQTGSVTFEPHGYEVRFDHVSFAYEGERGVIRDVSFAARQGETTALVGPSGSGKSTLSKLACRFWDVSEGRVTVGGVDVSEVDPERLLQAFSIVFQEVVLFDDTIANNIRIGRADANDEDVRHAAHLARCEEFIGKLPDGYHTVIGENGKMLSGGERQRISIARAFLKDAPIVLLDEATASLDPENETAVQQALSSLCQDKTVIVIAHRLRSVEGCDQIVVLDEGRVVERGTHGELMETDGLYARLFCLQRQNVGWSFPGAADDDGPADSSR